MTTNGFRFPKGSEWRIWDLHLHSPSTSLNNQFEGTSEQEKWERYFQKLSSLTDIAVLGITDYFSVDGYRKVSNYKTHGNLNHIDLILPNVELRILPVTQSELAINLHIIFSPEVVDELDDKFFSSLKFHYRNENFKCTRNELIRLGRTYRDDTTLAEEVAYRNGVEQFKTTIEEIQTILTRNRRLKENAIVVVSNSSRDGNSGIQHSSLAAARQEIYRFANCIFSGNPNDRDYFLGNGNDNLDEIVRKYGSPKPCIHGSDAHSLEKIFNPDLRRFTWIKADPTFEGLKQIICEPESRVKIQQDRPEEKTSYLMIDKVRFLDNQANKKFCDQWIELNPNLTTIIGGKSSGKSLLLYFIAKTIDSKQVEERNGIVQLQNYDIKNDADFDFEVQWMDGEQYRLKQDIGTKNRRITYIPQMFINTLAEEKGEPSLQKLILEILLQNENFRKFYSESRSQIKTKNEAISTAVIALFSLSNEFGTLKDELRMLGDKQAISKEIAKALSQIDELRTKSGFSDEENKQYKELALQKQAKEKESARAKTIRDNLENFRTYLSQLANEVSSAIETKLNEYKEKFVDDLQGVNVFEQIAQNVTNSMKQALSNSVSANFSITDTYNANLKNLDAEITSTNAKLTPYLAKFENQGLLSKLQTNIDEQRNLLVRIEEKEKQIKNTEERINRIKDDIFNNYKEMIGLYDDIEALLSLEEYKRIAEDIELHTILSFDLRQFSERFESILDKRFDLHLSLPSFNANKQFNYDRKNHLESIRSTFDLLFSGNNENVKLKTGRTSKDAISNLLDDYFVIKFDLVQNSDPIIDMSPGKRGLVLLKLYLHLSNADHPILIDQPEDNLDNRTIYKELNNFVRQKKIKRQIIMVSHNPNLVVSTDAEEVIVANQSGQLTGKDNRQYLFEFVTGALECNFDNPIEQGILYKKGIRDHVCEILEGGKDAFEKREQKYGFRY